MERKKLSIDVSQFSKSESMCDSFPKSASGKWTELKQVYVNNKLWWIISLIWHQAMFKQQIMHY